MSAHQTIHGSRLIVGLVATGNIGTPTGGFDAIRRPRENLLFGRDNTPVPERLREAAARLANLSLVPLSPPWEGETFSARAWEIIRQIEGGVRRSNVVETYWGLVPGLPSSAWDNPSTAGARALRRFRGMVMAHGYVFRDHFGRETIVQRPLPRLQHDL